LAENAFMVASNWQGIGLGTTMLQRMIEHAMARSLRGFVFEILQENERMLNVVELCCKNITMKRSEEAVYITLIFDQAVTQHKRTVETDDWSHSPPYAISKPITVDEIEWSPYPHDGDFENRIC
jgi:hypothetical protein